MRIGRGVATLTMEVFILISLTFLVSSAMLVAAIPDWDTFATKTAYSWAVDTTQAVVTDEYMTADVDGRQCTAIHVTSVFRHGERYPGADDMEYMTELQNKIIANKGENVFNFIKTWVNTYPPAEEKELVDVGREQLRDLGQRLRKRLGTLFTDSYESVELISSSKRRTIESAEKFYSGLSGEDTHSRSSTVDNDLVRYYDDCSYYEKTVEDNPTLVRKFDSFKDSQTFGNTKQGIYTRLGFTNATLTNGELELMYEMCAFEKYCFNRSAWCDFMQDADRLVMEYATDLAKYYETSYGNDVSRRLACVILKDVLSQMDNVTVQHKAGTSYQTGRFMFGHSETLVPLYTAMGLFEDDTPPTASNMAAMGSRKFKTSRIVPMSANIAFVLYACPDPETQYKYAVKLMVNEAETNLPTCDKPVCWLDDVKQTYADQTSDCDRDELCARPVSRGVSTHMPSLVGTMVSLVTMICFWRIVINGVTN